MIAYKDFQPYKCEITKSEIDLTSIPSRWAPVDARTACLDAELHLRLLVRPRGKVVVLAQEVVIVCLCLKDTEIHATSKQRNTTNSALESLHSLHLPRT